MASIIEEIQSKIDEYIKWNSDNIIIRTLEFEELLKEIVAPLAPLDKRIKRLIKESKEPDSDSESESRYSLYSRISDSDSDSDLDSDLGSGSGSGSGSSSDFGSD